jgi:hypothetical protein
MNKVQADRPRRTAEQKHSVCAVPSMYDCGSIRYRVCTPLHVLRPDMHLLVVRGRDFSCHFADEAFSSVEVRGKVWSLRQVGAGLPSIAPPISKLKCAGALSQGWSTTFLARIRSRGRFRDITRAARSKSRRSHAKKRYANRRSTPRIDSVSVLAERPRSQQSPTLPFSNLPT